MLKVFGSEIRNQEKFLANSLEFPIVQTYNSIYRQKSHMTLTFDDQNIQIPKIFLNILTWFFDVNFFIIFPKYTEFLRTTLISKATLYWVTVSFCTWRWVMKKCQYKLLIIAVLFHKVWGLNQHWELSVKSKVSAPNGARRRCVRLDSAGSGKLRKLRRA